MKVAKVLLLLFSLGFAKEAIILGSSGLVGGLVVQNMLESPSWSTVHIITRKPSKIKHAKINEILVPDLNQMTASPQLQKLNKGDIDAAVVTLGVNEPFGWTVQQLLDVEVGLTSIFADFCHTQLGVKYISFLGGVGTERGYTFSAEELAVEINWWNLFYLFPHLKGNVEDALLASGIPYTSIFRPANFETDEYRFGIIDVALQTICSVLNFVVPSKYHSIHVNVLARAMFEDAELVTEEIGEGIVKKDIVKHYEDMIILNKKTDLISG